MAGLKTPEERGWPCLNEIPIWEMLWFVLWVGWRRPVLFPSTRLPTRSIMNYWQQDTNPHNQCPDPSNYSQYLWTQCDATCCPVWSSTISLLWGHQSLWCPDQLRVHFHRQGRCRCDGSPFLEQLWQRHVLGWAYFARYQDRWLESCRQYWGWRTSCIGWDGYRWGLEQARIGLSLRGHWSGHGDRKGMAV